MLDFVSFLQHGPGWHHMEHQYRVCTHFNGISEHQYPNNSDEVAQVEYNIGISNASPAGIAAPTSSGTGSGPSAPIMRLYGSKGVTNEIHLVPDMKAGKSYQMSIIGADVGKLKGVELSNQSGYQNWTPTVLRIRQFLGPQATEEIAVNRPIFQRTFVPVNRTEIS